MILVSRGCRWKKIKNRSIFGEDMDNHEVERFFWDSAVTDGQRRRGYHVLCFVFFRFFHDGGDERRVVLLVRFSRRTDTNAWRHLGRFLLFDNELHVLRIRVVRVAEVSVRISALIRIWYLLLCSPWGAFTCLGWQVTLCDPIRQVTLRNLFDLLLYVWNVTHALPFLDIIKYSVKL